jgi:drug/metabolite transporter (DMT)-like permease
VIVGLLLALGAAVTTGVASVLQALAARRAPATDAGSVSRLVASPLYLGGVALDGLGFVCIVAALHWLPLFLVQCATASSVGVTALVGRRVLGSVLGRRELTALIGLGVGLVLLASGAKAEAATAMSHGAQWWLLVAAVPVIAVGAVALRRHGARAGGALAAIAGLAFAGTGVGSRVLSDTHSVHDIVVAPAAYALVVFGIAGMVFFAAALQRTVVTIATAALFGVETLAASAVGLLALGDTTRPGFEVPAALGFVVTLGCAVLLALTEGQRGVATEGQRGVATEGQRGVATEGQRGVATEGEGARGAAEHA